MRIAVSGTHFIGKSTFIAEFVKKHPEYRSEVEAYYLLQDQKPMELSLEPSLDSLLEQLDCSIDQLNKSANQQNIIFDRSPVDYLAYAMHILEEDHISVHDSEISERFEDIKAALNHLDLIVFMPISNENSIEYTEENPEYRKAVDKCFKKIYRDDIWDIFPSYNHPKIIEMTGDRHNRIAKIQKFIL
ncbi:MAG: AAA family ATPase [Candidatus Berkiella sp.]